MQTLAIFISQVKLLKEGKEIPAELEQQMKEGKTKESEEKEKVEGMNSELSSLRDKVRTGQEGHTYFTVCYDSIYACLF